LAVELKRRGHQVTITPLTNHSAGFDLCCVYTLERRQQRHVYINRNNYAAEHAAMAGRKRAWLLFWGATAGMACTGGKGPVETVPVPEPKPGETLIIENGIVGRAAVVQQARVARQVIEKHHPDRIVTLGGDCLVDLAPIAYLNTRYGGNLGVLWVDAHPDVMIPKDFAHVCRVRIDGFDGFLRKNSQANFPGAFPALLMKALSFASILGDFPVAESPS
jgi:hypothetical protein